jgi:hypothetical protein
MATATELPWWLACETLSMCHSMLKMPSMMTTMWMWPMPTMCSMTMTSRLTTTSTCH